MRTVTSLLRRVDPRGVHLWGRGYLESLARREAPDPHRPVHLYVCIADHYEPRWRRPTLEVERSRVTDWVNRYPAIADRHRDHAGRPHVRSLFFPVEEYRPEHLDGINVLRGRGLVDVEVHLHHDDDTADHLRQTLTDFAKLLHTQHGCLRAREDGTIEYAFIHGNWALDNSHPEGLYCGVNNELSVLVETGCYADMTLPCVPSPCQTPRINEVYYARGAPGRARAHETGRPVTVGSARRDGELMLIPGPFGLHLRSRARGLVPRIEAAMLEPENPVPAAMRVASWIANAPALPGAPNHRFIKLHAHGCNGTAPDWFLTPDGPFDRLLTTLEDATRDADRYVLHYVTARELYETVVKLENGTLH